MNSKKLSEKYDYFYRKADALFREHNPCQFKDGRCINDTLRDPGNGCCDGHRCKHLSPGGCTAKALGCKFYVCNRISKTHTDFRNELGKLERAFIKEAGTPALCFQDKEQFFALNGGTFKEES